MTGIERRIITALVNELRERGYQPAAFWDAGFYQLADGKQLSDYAASTAPPITKPLTMREVLAAVESTGMGTLHFTEPCSGVWGNRGIFLVLGNDEDVVSDYHCKDEQFSAAIERVCRRASAGEFE